MEKSGARRDVLHAEARRLPDWDTADCQLALLAWLFQSQWTAGNQRGEFPAETFTLCRAAVF